MGCQISKFTMRNIMRNGTLDVQIYLVRNRTSDVQIYIMKTGHWMSKFTMKNNNEKQDIGCPNIPSEKQDIGCLNLPSKKRKYYSELGLISGQNHKFGPDYVNKGIMTSNVQNHSPWAAHIRL